MKKISILGSTGSIGVNALKVIDKRQDRIAKESGSYIAKGLLNASEALTAYRDSKFKYGARPEAMCSQSIDTLSGVTASFCYKTTNVNFLAKYSSSYYSSTELDANVTGSKVGMDRNGKIIRLRNMKNIDILSGIPESDARIEYKGPDKTSWWRSLNATHRKDQIAKAQACAALRAAYGARIVNDMTVVDQFRDLAAWDAYMNRNCR